MPKYRELEEGLFQELSDLEREARSRAWTIGTDDLLSGSYVRFTLFEPAPQRTPSHWVHEAKANLRDLLGLHEDWDSYGAEPVDLDAVKRASEVLDYFAREHAPQPSVLPTVEGGVELEWFRNGIELRVQAHTDGHVTTFYRNVNDPSFTWEGEFGQEPDLVKVLWWLGDH